MIFNHDGNEINDKAEKSSYLLHCTINSHVDNEKNESDITWNPMNCSVSLLYEFIMHLTA